MSCLEDLWMRKMNCTIIMGRRMCRNHGSGPNEIWTFDIRTIHDIGKILGGVE